jgi:SAM-dependent methyltransferase
MEPEGMVHALEEIHRVTRPAGTLIEIHPALEFPFLEVRSNEELFFSENDPGFDYEEDSRHAEAAVATVVGRGLFVLEESRRFELRIHASSLQELRDHWAVADAYITEEKEETLARRAEEMYARADQVLQRSPGAELVYVEPATISRLMLSAEA